MSDSDKNCKRILDYITETTGDVDQMDSRYFDSEKIPDDTFSSMFKSAKRLEELKKALHISKK